MMGEGRSIVGHLCPVACHSSPYSVYLEMVSELSRVCSEAKKIRSKEHIVHTILEAQTAAI